MSKWLDKIIPGSRRNRAASMALSDSRRDDHLIPEGSYCRSNAYNFLTAGAEDAPIQEWIEAVRVKKTLGKDRVKDLWDVRRFGLRQQMKTKAQKLCGVLTAKLRKMCLFLKPFIS